MGKVRRLRQKYHNLLKKDNEKKEEPKGLSYDDIVAGNFNKINLPSQTDYDATNNPFANIQIDFNDLKTKLADDCMSVCSNVSKRLSKYDANGKLLKKDEKRKRRHDLFLKKLDIVNQARLEVRNKKRKKNPKNDVTNKLNVINDDDVPVLVPITKKCKNPLPRPVKKRGIEKTKKRKQNMLDDIAAFRKVVSEHQDNSDVFSSVTECVLRKVLEEAENEKS
ncbi:hypothetical protein LSTR_LSTR007740 [Laodelphax striatellus]|uniref:Uncharacterized protein n=1 Tax=Laodelphax striatellus TaxID=195883 RepID=A0A482WKD2_LAOST|nr:hypothetical protein LSTR_LSTR007740 [Laodelphax striatellus]